MATVHAFAATIPSQRGAFSTLGSPGPPRCAALQPGQPTELPDSLADAAVRAAEATVEFCDQNGSSSSASNRCRIDFDTSIGDETYTLLKQSSEFMQQYVTAISYALIPTMQQQRQTEIMSVATAKVELASLRQQQNQENADQNAATRGKTVEEKEQREDELMEIIVNDGRDPKKGWEGGITRVYFPDEGSAALARRDWASVVPACVQFSSCGGIQLQDTSKDIVQLFFCPRASESDSVESILAKMEASDDNNLKLSVFVNPVLVDMGVTGFGMAGRRLRERLLNNLVGTYYLRTLPWGALTRQWPAAYTVWQEDADAVGGYKLVQTLDRLPSNPEVEDIYDIANGNMAERQSGGLLDQFGDFVNGMMRL